MKRDVIVSQLIKEGFSEKTLVRFSDKQLSDLHERIVIDADKLKTDQKLKDLANDPNTEVEVEEELKGKQKNIDKNHNGEIDAEDFAILNKEKKGETKEDVNESDMGLTIKGSKSSSSSVFGGVPKKSSSPKKKTTPKKKEEDVEEGDYHNERSEKALEKSKEDFPQLKNIKKCDECGKVMSKCTCKKEEVDESKPSAGLSKEKKSEVVKKAKKGGDIGKKGKGFEKLSDKAAKEYGSKEAGEKVAAASMWKNMKREGVEIKDWVKGLVENKEFHSFTSKNEIMELIQTKLNESDVMIQHGPKVKKGHNGIPEFMSYDAIVDAEPKTAPSKPAPQTKPGTRPTPTRREDPRKTPFQPGPGPNPKPKAKIAEEKKVK